MVNYCPNCGFKLEGQVKFCPSCGLPLEQMKVPSAEIPVQNSSYQQNNTYQQQPVSQDNPSWQNGPYRQAQQQDSYHRPAQQPYQQRIQKVRSENHITFIFVTSLIFMILFAIGCISALSSISDLQNYYQDIYIAKILDILVTFITFIAILVFFIFAANSINRNNNIQRRVRSSEILYILSVAAFSLGVLYLVSDIYYYAVSLRYHYYRYFILFDGIIGSFFFDAAFIVFSIVNIIKSRFFKIELKQKLQDSENFKALQQ